MRKRKRNSTDPKDKELKALFDRFKRADTEKKKYAIWKELTALFEKYPGARYHAPKGLDRMEWFRFVKYGWGHPLRIKELL